MSLMQLLYDLTEKCSAEPKPEGTVLLIGHSGYIPPHELHMETGYWCPARKRWMSDSSDNFTEGWPQPLLYVKLDNKDVKRLVNTLYEES